MPTPSQGHLRAWERARPETEPAQRRFADHLRVSRRQGIGRYRIRLQFTCLHTALGQQPQARGGMHGKQQSPKFAKQENRSHHRSALLTALKPLASTARRANLLAQRSSERRRFRRASVIEEGS
jgi:hypothetical protein